MNYTCAKCDPTEPHPDVDFCPKCDKQSARIAELEGALEMLVRFHESEPQPGLSSWHEWLTRSLEQARSALGKAGGE